MDFNKTLLPAVLGWVLLLAELQGLALIAFKQGKELRSSFGMAVAGSTLAVFDHQHFEVLDDVDAVAVCNQRAAVGDGQRGDTA